VGEKRAIEKGMNCGKFVWLVVWGGWGNKGVDWGIEGRCLLNGTLWEVFLAVVCWWRGKDGNITIRYQYGGGGEEG